LEGFNPAWAWAIIGLLLMLSELLTGAFVLLALGIAALITALVWPVTGMGLTGQLLTMAIASGILVPLAIYRIRPMFSPRGVRYGTTGTGAETGRPYRVEPMRFDADILAIKVNGDQYRIRVEDDHGRASGHSPREGDLVELLRFEGTTAIVRPTD